jgi:hypothetical protein
LSLALQTACSPMQRGPRGERDISKCNRKWRL